MVGSSTARSIQPRCPVIPRVDPAPRTERNDDLSASAPTHTARVDWPTPRRIRSSGFGQRDAGSRPAGRWISAPRPGACRLPSAVRYLDHERHVGRVGRLVVDGQATVEAPRPPARSRPLATERHDRLGARPGNARLRRSRTSRCHGAHYGPRAILLPIPTENLRPGRTRRFEVVSARPCERERLRDTDATSRADAGGLARGQRLWSPPTVR
jgi:hypothetical protein